LACDFFVAVTATFRVFYIFVVLDVGTRRILHWKVTDHPTADWTAQQFRMVVCQAISPIDGSFTTATASIPRASMPPWGPWV